MKVMPPGTMPHRELSSEEKEKMTKVSKDFESIFVNQMVSAMRKTVTKGGLIPESQAEKIYQSMLDNEFSRQLSESEQLGLSKTIYEHLLRMSGAR